MGCGMSEPRTPSAPHVVVSTSTVEPQALDSICPGAEQKIHQLAPGGDDNDDDRCNVQSQCSDASDLSQRNIATIPYLGVNRQEAPLVPSKEGSMQAHIAAEQTSSMGLPTAFSTPTHSQTQQFPCVVVDTCAFRPLTLQSSRRVYSHQLHSGTRGSAALAGVGDNVSQAGSLATLDSRLLMGAAPSEGGRRDLATWEPPSFAVLRQSSTQSPTRFETSNSSAVAGPSFVPRCR